MPRRNKQQVHQRVCRNRPSNQLQNKRALQVRPQLNGTQRKRVPKRHPKLRKNVPPALPKPNVKQLDQPAPKQNKQKFVPPTFDGRLPPSQPDEPLFRRHYRLPKPPSGKPNPFVWKPYRAVPRQHKTGNKHLTVLPKLRPL